MADPRKASDARNFSPSWHDLDHDQQRDALELFLACLPLKYIVEVIIPATNAQLVADGMEGTTLGEFLRWLGLALIASLNDAVPRSELWQDSIDPLRPHPNLREYMSRARFDAIQRRIRLVSGAAANPPLRDRFATVRGFIDAWNENMERRFIPSFMTCLDESMVAWLNKWTCPGWVHLPRKPHPFGNEYHTIACAATHIIFHVELVEGKDRPLQLPVPEHEAEFGKMGGLILRMTKTIRDSNRIVIMDSAFCQLRTLIAMKKRGLYATAVIKKKRYWPKHIKGDDMDEELKDTPIGTSKVLTGVLDGVPYSLVALRDSKHVLKLVSTWGNMDRVGRPKLRRHPITNQRVEFKYPSVISQYYQARHAVDDNNNIRQGSKSLEAGFQVNRWPLRQFLALVAVAEVNALCFFNYIRAKDSEISVKASLSAPTLAQFRQDLAKRLIHNKHLCVAEDTEPSAKRPRRSKPEHVLQKVPKYAGVWRNNQWTHIATPYAKHFCAGGDCDAEVREYCACDKLVFWCTDCWGNVHLRSIFTTAK